MPDFEIQRVSIEELHGVIEQYAPRGLFLSKRNHLWIAVDNTTNDAWTEEFTSKRQAIRWLRGEFEMDSMAEGWNEIIIPRELIEVAAKQGFQMNEVEADVVLGYMEGHEYILTANSDGTTARHDLQYENNHRGDQLYSIWETISFCSEMNEDLLDDCDALNEKNAAYRAELYKDRLVLDSLMERVKKQC